MDKKVYHPGEHDVTIISAEGIGHGVVEGNNIRVTDPPDVPGKPKECDFCRAPLKGKPHVDGKTFFGPWANMCLPCHAANGMGLGLGKGQMFDANNVKIAG